ncbi:MAG: sortase [Minisyncoccia bacterium]
MGINYRIKKELRLIFFIFIICFVSLLLILNSSFFAVVIPYKIQNIISFLKQEIQTPVNLNYSLTPLFENQKDEKKINIAIPLEIETQGQKENLIYLPKFNIVAPVLTVNSANLKTIYSTLRKGTVVYPSTDLPGQGYTIILGHSSQYPWEPGKYKTVFSLLNEFNEGDFIVIYWNKRKLIFKVEAKKIFLPWPKGNEITETIFPPQPNQKIVILQSCWPVGVAYKRVAVKTVLVDTK